MQISLVSPENYLVFQPMLPEVISGTLEILHVISPIRRIVPHATLYVRAVESIDVEQRLVRLAPGYGLRHLDLEYDHLVIALGTNLAAKSVPGLAEHAIPFKYLGDALRLRNHLVHMLEEAAIAENPKTRRRLLTFVVAGGGFSGVECIAEMHDFLMHAVKAYPGLTAKDLRTVLLQNADHILPEMKPSLASFAHRLLEKRGVEIVLNTRLTAVTEQAAVISHKPTGEVSTIPARTVGGDRAGQPHPLLGSLPLPRAGGRIAVNEFLHCSEANNIWAIGDCAAIPLPDGNRAAHRPARGPGGALLCSEHRGNSESHAAAAFQFKALGALASLGRHSAVAEVLGIRLSGILAWILWRVIYLRSSPASIARPASLSTGRWTCSCLAISPRSASSEMPRSVASTSKQVRSSSTKATSATAFIS